MISYEDYSEVERELDKAQSAIERVRALHRRGDSTPWCEHCDVRGDQDPVLWPCPTLQALDQED